jgi:hypothetical protein
MCASRCERSRRAAAPATYSHSTVSDSPDRHIVERLGLRPGMGTHVGENRQDRDPRSPPTSPPTPDHRCRRNTLPARNIRTSWPESPARRPRRESSRRYSLSRPLDCPAGTRPPDRSGSAPPRHRPAVRKAPHTPPRYVPTGSRRPPRQIPAPNAISSRPQTTKSTDWTHPQSPSANIELACRARSKPGRVKARV